MARIIRLVVILFAVLLAGCDPISRTEISVRPQNRTDSAQAIHTIIEATAKLAASFGLEEIERRDTDVSFSDSRLRPGHNPDLWLAIKHGTTPTTIEITEMYIAHPTDKHKQISNALIQNLITAGYHANVTYKTPDARNLAFYFGAFVVALMPLLVWKLATRWMPNIPRESAT